MEIFINGRKAFDLAEYAASQPDRVWRVGDLLDMPAGLFGSYRVVAVSSIGKPVQILHEYGESNGDEADDRAVAEKYAAALMQYAHNSD